MACAPCRARTAAAGRPQFVVTDDAGECLILDGGGCKLFTTVGGAQTAAQHAGLAEFIVRPR